MNPAVFEKDIYAIHLGKKDRIIFFEKFLFFVYYVYE